MPTGRVCAYCGEAKGLTNEHVFPDCFQKTFEPITPTRTSAGEKAILSALEIHDVCCRCNNGPLSELDSYLCELNDSYFSKIAHAEDHILFQYDFDRLLRVLLKIGYNVARARKWPRGNWQRCAQYILGIAPCPVGFRVFLQIMIPTPVEKTNRPVSPGTTEVPPWPMSVYSLDVSRLPGIASAFWMSVWSYRFFILQEDMLASRSLKDWTLARWLRHTTGASELTCQGTTTMDASSVEVLDIVRDSPVFDEQLSQARKLKAATDLKRSGNH